MKVNYTINKHMCHTHTGMIIVLATQTQYEPSSKDHEGLIVNLTNLLYHIK